jgi:hypothetical protein
MQHERESEESGPTEFEEEQPVETPWAHQTYQLNNASKRIISYLIDDLRRKDAREAVALQDAERRHVEDTRYDINLYGGAPASIRDLCHVEKRKVR